MKILVVEPDGYSLVECDLTKAQAEAVCDALDAHFDWLAFPVEPSKLHRLEIKIASEFSAFVANPVTGFIKNVAEELTEKQVQLWQHFWRNDEKTEGNKLIFVPTA